MVTSYSIVRRMQTQLTISNLELAKYTIQGGATDSLFTIPVH